MKRAFHLSIVVILAFAAGLTGCGGAGDADLPGGLQGGEPVELNLVPNQYVVRTGGIVFLQAKVIDGNGQPVVGKLVYFAAKTGIGELSSPTALTDEKGMATVTITSFSTGYAIVEASSSSNFLLDRTTIFFNGEVASPRVLTLHIDGNGTSCGSSGGWNELDDFYLFEHDTLLVRANLTTNTGVPVYNEVINFYTDFSSEVTFYDNTTGAPTTTATTNSAGNACIMIKSDEVIALSGKNLNLYAYDSTGALDIITLFIDPVRINQIIFTVLPDYVFPEIVAPGTPITVTVKVFSTSGIVPDGTVVRFDVDLAGSTMDEPIVFYVPTIGGEATLEIDLNEVPGISNFVPGILNITASVGGMSVTGNILLLIVVQTLHVPNTMAAGSTVTATITGGIGQYEVFSLRPDVIDVSGITPVGEDGVSGATFEITAASICGYAMVNLMVTDSRGIESPGIIEVIGPACPP